MIAVTYSTRYRSLSPRHAGHNRSAATQQDVGTLIAAVGSGQDDSIKVLSALQLRIFAALVGDPTPEAIITCGLY